MSGDGDRARTPGLFIQPRSSSLAFLNQLARGGEGSRSETSCVVKPNEVSPLQTGFRMSCSGDCDSEHVAPREGNYPCVGFLAMEGSAAGAA